MGPGWGRLLTGKTISFTIKLKALGKSTSNDVEVLGVSKEGVWLWVKNREYLLPHEAYPWFKSAKISDIYNVRLLHGIHLHWPALDVDLEVDSLGQPTLYPLVYR